MFRLLERALLTAIAVGFAVMVIATVLQVVSRYVFQSPLGWTEELAKLLMVWWTFLAVGVLAWRGKLLGIDAALMALDPRAAHFLVAGAQGVSAVTIAVLTWLGFRLVKLAGSQITPALDIPYSWVYLSLPVGFFIATVGFAWRSVRHFRLAMSDKPDHPIIILERADT